MDQVTVAADRLVAALRQVLPAASRNRKDNVLVRAAWTDTHTTSPHLLRACFTSDP
jgi:hypothetical protein